MSTWLVYRFWMQHADAFIRWFAIHLQNRLHNFPVAVRGKMNVVSIHWKQFLIRQVRAKAECLPDFYLRQRPIRLSATSQSAFVDGMSFSLVIFFVQVVNTPDERLVAIFRSYHMVWCYIRVRSVVACLTSSTYSSSPLRSSASPSSELITIRCDYRFELKCIVSVECWSLR